MHGIGVSAPIAADVAAATVGFAKGHAHSEWHNIGHRKVIHDIRVGLLAGERAIRRQDYERTRRHPKAALHNRSHTNLHRHDKYLRISCDGV